MREKTALTRNLLYKLRGDIMYQVIMRDILEVFGYDKDTKEYQMISDLIENRHREETLRI